jgi:predicted nucleotidyltransferase
LDGPAISLLRRPRLSGTVLAGRGSDSGGYMPLTDSDITRLVAICREYGVRRVDLFGSVARGDERPESDIDLVVRFERPRSLLEIVQLERRLSQALGRKVDLLTEKAISPYIRERIESEMQVIYEAG